MASLVQELEQDAYNSSASLSNMLRKAKAVAVKLQLQQPMEWVEAELNGYTSAEVPNYWVIAGRAKSRNPFHGWQPLMFGSAYIERMVCEFPIRNSVKEIEHLMESEGEPSIALSGKQVETLCEMAGTPTLLPISVFFPRGRFISILDAVRNKVLDWSLQLQVTGIKGEGMSFLPEEKAKVSGKGDTYHIGSIGNLTGNLGGQVGGDVNATSTQDMEQELEKVATLVAQLRTYQGQMGLDARQQSEVSKHVDALDEELRGGKPEPRIIKGLLKSIKAMTEGAAGNLVASGVISAISNINL